MDNSYIKMGELVKEEAKKVALLAYFRPFMDKPEALLVLVRAAMRYGKDPK